MVWFDADYGYKKKITIDNTKVAGDETDFPVLISVTDNDLRGELDGGHVKHNSGYDIIFTNGIETVQLKHEIERYVSTSGLLVFWVKIPSLSSTADTDIYIYYGKAGVGADPSTTDTWDANFIFVSHMANNPDTTHIKDSTSNGNDGTKDAATEPEQVLSNIGYGQDFELGSTEKIRMDNAVAPLTAVSLECWFKPETIGITQELIADCYDTTYYYNEMPIIFFLSTDNKVHFQICKTPNAVMFNLLSGSIITPAGVWYNIVATWDNSDSGNAYIYKNGSEVANTTGTGTMASSGDHELTIGVEKDAATWRYYADGIFSEVRISNIARSPQWLLTTHETQNDPAGFMSWGAEEEKPVSEVGAAIYYHDGTNNIELQRDNSSPVQMYNGVEIIGLKLGETNDPNASPFHVYDGTTIKAILKMP